MQQPSAAGRNRYALKIIGLLLFAWLLSRIDRAALLAQLRDVHLLPLAVSLAVFLLSDLLKVARWHVLVRATGLPVSFHYSWRTYNIGLFLGLITPGKVGELGRAGYLRRSGLRTGTAISVVLVDRVFDVAAVGLMSLAALGVLFGARWFVVGLLTSALVGCVIALGALRTYRARSGHEWLSFLLSLTAQPLLLLRLLLLTVAAWAVYCAWAAMLASSIDLHVTLLLFVSSVILAGVLALLPIAPSGLGTRDAALVWLLHPLGIGAPRAVALSFLMFISTIVTSLIGGWYWLRGVPQAENRS